MHRLCYIRLNQHLTRTKNIFQIFLSKLHIFSSKILNYIYKFFDKTLSALWPILHEVIINFIVFFYQTFLLFRQIHPIKKLAALLVLHNIFLYYVINMFKHLAQASIGSAGPVNTFYYVPFVYETPAAAVESGEDWHVVLTTPQWQFFESLFRHHLALLLPFNLSLLVPHCKMALISTLVLASNLLMFICFTSAICQWLLMCGPYGLVPLMPILCLGPVCQMLVLGFLLARIWRSPWIVYDEI
ncbi:uncharacterized protein LOC111074236 [Drosophila obscura]|uniref:uncharacterized protein LOC111074236 n=1 Tax=Drosophila obscura TaxID=7282 RepID=UPI001BB1D79A|nr:uncharacterized protein LOC111074236 [Drosophila obscura]